jgi:hypothetical protein
MENILDKKFPTFLDLVVEAGRLEIDSEIPMVSKNQFGELQSPMDHISFVALQALFYKYLLSAKGIENTNSEEEIERLWDKNYFTLRHFIGAIALAKLNVKDLQQGAKIRKEVAKKELREKTLIHSNFSGPQKAFIIFYEKIGTPVKKGNESLYEDCRIWSLRTNRVKSDLETNKKRIRLFERMIPELSPDAQLLAEKDFWELKQNIKNEEDRLT